MTHRWTSARPLYRVNGADVQPGEEFEPSEAELRSFGDAIEAVDDAPATCEVVKSDGEVCGRPKPCRYHSDDDEE